MGEEEGGRREKGVGRRFTDALTSKKEAEFFAGSH